MAYEGENRRIARETARTNWMLVLAAFLFPLLGAVAYGATLHERVKSMEGWRQEIREDLKEIRKGIEELQRRPR